MKTAQSHEQKIEKLLQGRKAALVGFFIVLVSATAYIGIGTAIQNGLMVYYGFIALLSSPVLLTVAVAIRQKVKRELSA